jgi:D-alanine-D-alanine ligase
MSQKTPKALIYHTALSENATKDDLDVIDETDFVSGILKNLGYKVDQIPFNYKETKNQIKEINPYFIFNLVESVNEKDSLAYLAPTIFDRLGVPYTGCTSNTFFNTKSKVDTKIILREKEILTPYWIILKDLHRLDIPRKKFLIKSRIDHASKNLETTLLEDRNALMQELSLKGRDFFAEEYIEGREFNVSIVGPSGEGRVLPQAEIIFSNWSSNKLKIVDYAAKWDETSHEYHNTDRTFNFSDKDKPLLEDIEEICKKCWNIFDLRGYARVDFRVDKENNPYVLEINTNPCISPDAGFIAAAHQAGMTDEQVIKNIIKDSCGERFVL